MGRFEDVLNMDGSDLFYLLLKVFSWLQNDKHNHIHHRMSTHGLISVQYTMSANAALLIWSCIEYNLKGDLLPHWAILDQWRT